jgi:protein ImuA
MDHSCAPMLAAAKPELPAFDAAVHEVSLHNLPHQKRQATIAALKARLACAVPLSVSDGAPINQHPVWNLGAPEIDALLGPAGLELGGIHAIALSAAVPGQSAASVAASARLFALLLLHRRLAVLRACSSLSRASARVLWCAMPTDLGEGGHLYAPALARMGFDPGQFIFVTPTRAVDVLWAMEEGLRSNALAAVVGQLDDVGLTPARRLSLAAAAANTPCIVVANKRAVPVAAVATRWRIGPLRSGSLSRGALTCGSGHEKRRVRIGLERCRAQPVGSGSVVFAGEWSDDAHCFRVVAGPADRALAPRLGTPELASPVARGDRHAEDRAAERV